MGHPLLRLNDGRDDTSPQLRPDVEDLQRALNMHGLSVEVDGVFGTDTRAAVQQFQHEQGLNDDGIVGPLTWAALEGQPPPDPRTTIPHTIPSSDVAILRQFAEATKYKPLVDTACSATNLATYIIGGLGSRESNWGLVLTPPGPAGTGDFAKRRFPTPHRSGPLPGDGGFGRGLLQIDYDANEFARTGNWRDAGANILCGCQVLADCLAFFKRKTSLTDTALWRATLAAYNCGPGNALRAVSDGRDVDFYTTGHDYSHDVLNRAGFFQANGWT